VAGNLGADGGGQTVITDFAMNVDGSTFSVFTKSVNDHYNYDPAVVHIFILPQNDQVTHHYETNTNSDYDEIRLSGGELGDFYYLLMSNRPRYIPSQEILENIVTEFIRSTN